MEKGINVLDPKDGSVVGKSRVAAKKAVMETAISRYILCIPLFLPSMGLYGLERAKLMPRNAGLQLGIQMTFFFLELYVAVPLAISVYPQTGVI